MYFAMDFILKSTWNKAYYLAAHAAEQTIVHLDVNSNNKNDILSIKILIWRYLTWYFLFIMCIYS